MTNTTNSKMVIYTAPDGTTQVTVRTTEDNNVWLPYKDIARLFRKDESTIREHLENLFSDGEIDRDRDTGIFPVVTMDGKTRTMTHYNLRAIIHVGYRTKSQEAIAFRNWASAHLMNILIDGVSLDEASIATDPNKYLMMIKRTNAVRLEESNAWRQLRDKIISASDYHDGNVDVQKFMSNIQNMIHYATHGQTAAEVIKSRAHHSKPFMGLTTFRGTIPDKFDITIAKNYLTQDELSKMNNLIKTIVEVTNSISHSMTLNDWYNKVYSVLNISEKPLLKSLGNVKMSDAKTTAYFEFHHYQKLMEGQPNAPKLSKDNYIIDILNARDKINNIVMPLLSGYVVNKGIAWYSDEIANDIMTLLVNCGSSSPMHTSAMFIDSLRNSDHFLQYYNLDSLNIDDLVLLSSFASEFTTNVNHILSNDADSNKYEITTVSIDHDRALVSLTYV